MYQLFAYCTSPESMKTKSSVVRWRRRTPSIDQYVTDIPYFCPIANTMSSLQTILDKKHAVCEL